MSGGHCPPLAPPLLCSKGNHQPSQSTTQSLYISFFYATSMYISIQRHLANNGKKNMNELRSEEGKNNNIGIYSGLFGINLVFGS
jgi:hypothetical protein